MDKNPCAVSGSDAFLCSGAFAIRVLIMNTGQFLCACVSGFVMPVIACLLQLYTPVVRRYIPRGHHPELNGLDVGGIFQLVVCIAIY